MEISITSVPTLLDSSNGSFSLTTSPVSVGGTTRYSPSNRSARNPKVSLRRRCHSECLQLAPAASIGTLSDMKRNELLPEMHKNAFNSVLQNGSDHRYHTAHSHHNHHHLDNCHKIQWLNGSTVDIHPKENTKENIATVQAIEKNIKCQDVNNDLDELVGLKVEKINSYSMQNSDHLCTDKALLKHQEYLYKLNQEIDKKYCDILLDARKDSTSVLTTQTDDVVTSPIGQKTTLSSSELIHKRRARARRESEPVELCQRSSLSSTFRLNKCTGDDLSLKRLRDSKATKSSGLSVSPVPEQTNGVLQGKNLPPAIKVFNNQNRKIVPNYRGHYHRYYLSGRLQSNNINIARQKILLKARQQQLKQQQSIKTKSAMVISVPIEGTSPSAPSPVASSKVNGNHGDLAKAKANENSESEYSSLEDDDDFAAADTAEADTNDSLSDIEEGLQLQQSISAALPSGSPVDRSLLPNVSMVADCVQGYRSTEGPLSPSLFPNVPPYITFSSHEKKGPQMPPTIHKILKWKLTTITPLVIRKILVNSGFRLLKKTNDWMGVWGKHMKSPCFKTVRSHQKMNHLPGSFQIGRKDRLWRNLQTQMSRHGKKEFNFMPRTYIIPHDLKQLKRVWPRYNQVNTKWIIKPPASARGVGIKVINKWSQIPKRKPLIVQKYIDRPLLINGSKFDLRLYVLVTSINPLRIYMHTDGLARFASVKYSEKSDTLSDRYMHLTNYSINKLSANYTSNEDATACQGHKWTIKSLWTYLSNQGVNTQRLWGALRNLVLRTILAGEHAIHQMSKGNVGSKYNCFELFGIDVILDAELKPWLLEVNISPSLHSASPLDLFVKGPLVTALLNTALYNVPPKLTPTEQETILADQGLPGDTLCHDKRLYVSNLTKAERTKHNQFCQRSMSREIYLDAILENLTPDDIRCLLTTEDELHRCAPLERIFPTTTSHRYLQFTENPRYYNRLLDAWETRYSNKREEGIALLRKYCDNKVHLIIPPQPAKKACVNNDDDTNVNSDDELEDATTNGDSNTISDIEIKNASDSGDSVPEVGDLDEEVKNFTKSDKHVGAKKFCNGFIDKNALKVNSNNYEINSTKNSTITTTLPMILHGEEPTSEDKTNDILKSSPSKLSKISCNDHQNFTNGVLSKHE